MQQHHDGRGPVGVACWQEVAAVPVRNVPVADRNQALRRAAGNARLCLEFDADAAVRLGVRSCNRDSSTHVTHLSNKRPMSHGSKASNNSRAVAMAGQAAPLRALVSVRSCPHRHVEHVALMHNFCHTYVNGSESPAVAGCGPAPHSTNASSAAVSTKHGLPCAILTVKSFSAHLRG